MAKIGQGALHVGDFWNDLPIQIFEDKLQGFGKSEQALPCLSNEFGFAGHLGTNGCETGIRLVRGLMMMMMMMMVMMMMMTI